MVLNKLKQGIAMRNKVFPLLERLLEGKSITDEEVSWLRSIRRIYSSNEDPKAKKIELELTNLHLELLSDFIPELEWLDLGNTNVSDLTMLTRLSRLQHLNLDQTEVSDFSPLAELKNLQQLYLDFTNVVDLSWIEGLKALKSLSLAHTKVNDLIHLAKLSELSYLNISYTEVNDLTPLIYLQKLSMLISKFTNVSDLVPLRGLNELTILDLDSTKVSNLISLTGLKSVNDLSLNNTMVHDLSPLKNLTNLEVLSLNDTQVNDISPLAKLTNLIDLSLNSSQITDISPLAELTKLKYLSLNSAPVNDISALEKLTNLEELLLDSTKVNSLASIEKMTKLSTLSLNNLHLDIIPSFCVREGLTLFLDDTILSRQPKALFNLPVEQILSKYYNETPVKINEGKVIFLGDPAVGKTHTIQRICSRGEKKEYNTKSTPGVDIQPFEYDDGTNIRFWDFGGQEIMQSMHHCFLTERTCYVVVVNNRTAESPMSQARRWLRTVAGFSKQVSVLLLVNRWSSVAADSTIISEELTDICPALTDVVYYSALDDTQEQFNRRVTDKIRQEVSRLDSIKLELPKSWADIREDMLKMPHPYISMEDYRCTCSLHGLDGRDTDSESIRMWLLEWFNDMGVCFSYHKNAPANAKALREYKVLQPKWLTEGIYRIIYNGSCCTASGLVSHEDLRSMLLLGNDSYMAVDRNIHFKKDDFTYILEVMRKFGRSFDHGDSREFIPETLSEQKPENPEPREQRFDVIVTYTIKLTYLPMGLLHHLMIKLFPNCDGLIWRRGMRLRNDDVVLIVEGNLDNSLLHFQLYRSNETESDFCFLFHEARWLALAYIKERRLVLEEETVSMSINKSLAIYPLVTLVQAWEKGEDTLLSFTKGDFGFVPVKTLLYPLFSKEVLETFTYLDKRQLWFQNSEKASLALTVVSMLFNGYFPNEAIYSNPILHHTLYALKILITDKRNIANQRLFMRGSKDNYMLSEFLLTNILDNTRFNHSNQLFKSINIFQPMTNTHKTEEEKRVWDRKEIRAINRDLIQWAITSPLYEMAVGDKDPDQILLSKALGQNESNRYEGSFALMQSIWNRYPELGMAPDYKFLSAKEYSGQYYAGYRDHTTHMFKVFLLGLFLYEKSEKIRSSIIEKIPSQQDFLSVWILTSLYHDVGYVIETEDGCWDSDAGMDVVKRLNDYLAHPFSYLYSDIMDIGTEEALQTRYNLTVAEFCGHYDIQQKLRYFKGIGPLVKLSLEEDANPVQGYYEYASSKRNGRQFFDHGIVGACMLLYSCEAVCDYMQGIKDKSVSIYPNQREKLYCFLAFSEKYKEFTKIAAQAIALHNIQKNWNETEIKDLNLLYGVTINSFCIPQKELPIAYLLRVCDELQCWDRQSFISPLGNTRMPLEQDKLCFLPRPSEVDLSVKNEKKREELEKALREVLEPPLYTIMELKD